MSIRRCARPFRLQRPPPHPQPAHRTPLTTSHERSFNQSYFAIIPFRAVIRPIREQDLVITSNGKPIAVLSATTGSTLETSLAALRQARAQLAVTSMQRARETGADNLSLDDVNAEIDATRRSRRR